MRDSFILLNTTSVMAETVFQLGIEPGVAPLLRDFMEIAIHPHTLHLPLEN